jgi:four helix bundle protein
LPLQLPLPPLATQQATLAKTGDCLKELDETAYWLELLAESSIVPKVKLANLRDECDQLLAIFTTVSRKRRLILHDSSS